ncbi:TonB-dependent receptor [Dysgonomonas sp. 216]|uniref:TonB-dependent receptor n=1 Tax=Dysgonomonas sp. 216 TaxID=2302934 RepID=UPI0013D4E13A|nr:TonB-dependent receptor [Dysgonomonas sp. 216]NDW18190.1 TonB-dependent receptor [Dysgonomonas sp. 216]
MKSLRIIIFLVTFPLLLHAEKYVKGYVYDNESKPVIGAQVHWENKQQGVVSDDKGFFEIEQAEGEHMLCVNYIGFEHQTVHIHNSNEIQKITLKENTQLDEIVITKSVPGRIHGRQELLQTEKIGIKELSRAACCNLSESFETNPSVDISYSDAVTGAKQIQLLGLSGTYVQMLTENYPNMRGTAGIYGMDYIPGPWMESIQVSKGAASVKNGYESITGQINIEYKKPKTADPLSLNIFASDAGRYEGNADGAIEINDKLSTGLFVHYSNEMQSHDDNDDTFLDAPKKHQFNIMNRWHYQTDNFISQSGIKVLNDERFSGQTRHTIGDATYTPYEIDLKTNRGEIFSKNGFIINPDKNESVALITSGSYHDLKSKYAQDKLNVYQTNLYASLMYERNFGDSHKLSSGLSINWDKYTQSIDIARLNRGNQPDKETVSGGYMEYTFMPTEKLTLLAGIRADYSSLHNWFITPRLHAKYDIAPWWTLRASAGKGYRTVFALPENGYLLASSRKINIENNLKQESAWNYGISANFYIPIGNEELAVTGEWYYSDFSNQAVIDIDSNPHEVSIYNLKGNSYANSFQIEASYPLFRGFTLMGAYRWTEAKTNYNGTVMRKPLVSRYKALATASYETPLRKWQFDVTAQFNGGGRMPAPDETNPLWSNQFKSYTVLNAQITKFFRDWSIYIGAENIGDFKQKNPIISADNPYSPDFDATMVWGPTMGRKFYAGIRYNISKL